jgi:hypothetical protein
MGSIEERVTEGLSYAQQAQKIAASVPARDREYVTSTPASTSGMRAQPPTSQLASMRLSRRFFESCCRAEIRRFTCCSRQQRVRCYFADRLGSIPCSTARAATVAAPADVPALATAPGSARPCGGSPLARADGYIHPAPIFDPSCLFPCSGRSAARGAVPVWKLDMDARRRPRKIQERNLVL